MPWTPEKARTITAASVHATMSTPNRLSSDTLANMAPSTLDLFVLTFNCAKNLINVTIFATHLLAALKQRTAGPELPDVVVFSLQEVAPLSYSFIGSYFLNPYYARFEEALNLAAFKFQLPDADSDEDATTTEAAAGPASPAPYTFVRAKNVGMTAILLFARDPTALVSIEEAEVGFGAAEMGNKGAVSFRVLYNAGEAGKTELTFVATHLAAMEWNLPRRNANWATIMRGLTFENPEDILNPKKRLAAGNGEGSDEGDSDTLGSGSAEEEVRLLHDQYHEQSQILQEKLQNISVFKPSSYLFVAGDLNYRISSASPPPLANFPSLDPESDHHHPRFFPLDQLTREREAGRTLHGLNEAKVEFPPTYKYVILPVDRNHPGNDLEVPWMFAPHRYPSWTDRILYMDIPPWTKAQAPKIPNVEVQAYDALPVIATSDHRPVFLRVNVPLVDPKAMVPPKKRSSDWSAEWNSDPRVTLPVAIDPEAWERRAAARRKEVMVGWSMFLWSTRQGALILATLMMVGIGTWVMYRNR